MRLVMLALLSGYCLTLVVVYVLLAYLAYRGEVQWWSLGPAIGPALPLFCLLQDDE